jgi:hypothetical protein
MAYDGWLEYDGIEIANLSRTAQLGQSLGISPVWLSPEESEWIQTELGGAGYENVANAPWYDAGYPASGEFAGFIPLGAGGLGDSSREASVIEFVTDGGRSGRSRNATLPIVLSGAIVASTERGADYGKRWLDKVLGARGSSVCAGVPLRYFAYAQAGAPILHYRDVSLTRGISITRKRTTDCDSVWLFTCTLTANDPFEYGEPQFQFEGLGEGVPISSPNVHDNGSTVLIQESCPVYDYSPLYDPLYPALVPSPTAPDFYPDGWGIVDGATFQRYWAVLEPVEPSATDLVPVITLRSDVDARMVRVSIWPSTSDTADQCDPLFSVVVSYLPADTPFYINGEAQASYVTSLLGTLRRTDSLVYSPDAKPVQWGSFNDTGMMMVTLDLFTDSEGIEGDGSLTVELSFIPKSD